MSFEIKIWFQQNDEKKYERFFNTDVHTAIRRTKRKHKNIIILNDESRTVTRKDKCIPDPPEGWRFAMFACKTKKNRWGRLVSVPEEMNYEPLNGNDDQKVSIQK